MLHTSRIDKNQLSCSGITKEFFCLMGCEHCQSLSTQVYSQWGDFPKRYTSDIPHCGLEQFWTKLIVASTLQNKNWIHDVIITIFKETNLFCLRGWVAKQKQNSKCFAIVQINILIGAEGLQCNNWTEGRNRRRIALYWNISE